MRPNRLSPLSWTTLLAVASFILGYVGYRTLMPAELGAADAVYRTMQLFAMDSQPESTDPWQLDVARFTAPLSLASAAVIAIAGFLRDQYQRRLIDLFARNHVVVIGTSLSSAAVAESMVTLGERVVVIAADANDPRLPGLRDLGVRCVIGDGRQPVTLRRARVERARHLVVSAGEDNMNLQIADLVRAVRADGDNRHATMHVAIDDPDLWMEISRLAFERSSSRLTVECFNEADRTAQRIVAAVTATREVSRVTLVGEGPCRDRIEAHLSRRAQLRGHAIEFVARPGADVPTTIVCDAAHGLGSALALARKIPTTYVAVAVASDTVQTLEELLGDLADRVLLVPTTSTDSAAGLLKDSAIEVMARAKHEDYLDHERAMGHTISDNSSLVPWEELPESLKESNRRFAASVAETLANAGAIIEPLRGDGIQVLPLTNDELDQLAVREHDRWASDLRNDGWSHSPGAKDPIAKTHPLLVPWDALDAAEQEKDRDAIRAIPQMLARIGYHLRIPR